MEPWQPGGDSEHPRKIFHTENEKVGGRGIPLPNTTLAREEIVQVTINSNRVGSRFHTSHNLMDKRTREPKMVQETFQESPMDGVKSFTEINLDEAFRRGPFPPIMPNQLLDSVDVIKH